MPGIVPLAQQALLHASGSCLRLIHCWLRSQLLGGLSWKTNEMQSELPIVVTSRSTLQERVALRLGPQVIDGRIPLSDCAPSDRL